MEIWRIDLGQKSLSRELVKAEWERQGGRGLTASILLDGARPTCYPLGRENKLVFAPGLLAGLMLPSCDRISIGGKSPLTGGIKEANAGGTTALALAQMGIKALILKDQLDDGPCVLRLSKQGVRFDLAADLAGLGVYAAADRLINRYGEKVQIALIGPAGEARLDSAGIQNLDKERVPSRIAARGGLGAVMGAMGPKAIVFDAVGGQNLPPADPEGLRKARSLYTRAVLDHPQSATYRDYGTAAMANMCSTVGELPTSGFSSGSYEKVEDISGEKLRALLLERGSPSNPTHACMPDCTIRCSNVVGSSAGNVSASPLEYENIGLLGSNLDIAEFDQIAALN